MTNSPAYLLIIGLAVFVSACGSAPTSTPRALPRPTFTPLTVHTARPSTATALPVIAVTDTPVLERSAPLAFAGADPGQKPLRLILVQHARCDWSPFWCPVEQGIQDAAREMNVRVTILGPDAFDLPRFAAQIDQAIAAKPDGIALTISEPQALREPILRAIASGVPIVAYNAGAGPIKDDLPYLTYLGADDYQSGYLSGYRLIKGGAKSGVCLNPIPDLAVFQNRCRGFINAFTENHLKAEMAGISSVPAQMQAAIQTYVEAHPAIDAYLTLGPSSADAYYAYLNKGGRHKASLLHATFDFSAAIQTAIENGTTLFAIDQQPYLQGYSAVFWLTMINRYGFRPASPVLSTGPSFIDKGSLNAANSPDRPVKLTLVHHGLCAWDSYWCIVDQGASDAARNMGVTLTIVGPETFDIKQVSALIDQANTARPDGLAVTIPDPALLHQPILRAIQSGYPVLAFDSGAGPINDNLPYLTFIGQDEYQVGYLAALRLIKAGARAGVCINQQVGQIALDRRCQGMIDAFREKGLTAEVLGTSGDAGKALQTIQDYARSHPDVNAFLTLGAADPGALSYYKYLNASGRKPGDALHGTFDLNAAVVSNIENGTTLFAVDAQPYLQGYTAVLFLTLYLRQNIRPASAITPTGPAFVDQNNVALVKQLAGKYR
ncbi:MAG: substrate-binding domain-containing protein [Anaerolineae bacterium]|nr:substrate-binding domain-containing protein [Anaerolineae bacterium]